MRFNRQRAYRNALGASPLEMPARAAWYRKPEDAHWRDITKLARQLARKEGLRVPVRITYGRGPTKYGAIGLALLTYSNGAVHSARIWIPRELPRSAAIDSLLHELAHVLYDQELGRRATAIQIVNDADAHPPRFWVIYGRLYNAWLAAYGN